jgi:hypothetical protein
MARVDARDGRAFVFPDNLTGTARLIGPQGGQYEFSAELLRNFLQWAANRNLVPRGRDEDE